MSWCVAWHVTVEDNRSLDLSRVVSHGERAAAFPSLSGDGHDVSYTSLADPVTGAADPKTRGPWIYVRGMSPTTDAEGPALDLDQPALVSDANGFAMYTSLSRDGTQLTYTTMEPACEHEPEVEVLGESRCAPDQIHVAYGTEPGFTSSFVDETVVKTEAGANAEPAISGNGRWIAWRSTAGAELLSDSDFADNEQVFMRSRNGSLAVDAIDFGEVARDSTAVATTIVRNEGTTTVSIDEVTSSAPSFTVVVGGSCVLATTLPPGASCTIAVQFDSHGLEGDFSESLDVHEVGYDPLSASGALHARVAPPPVILDDPAPTEPSTPPDTNPPDTTPPTSPTPDTPETTAPPSEEPAAAVVQATPNPLDFGVVPVGIPSAAPSVVTVENIGHAAEFQRRPGW